MFIHNSFFHGFTPNRFLPDCSFKRFLRFRSDSAEFLWDICLPDSVVGMTPLSFFLLIFKFWLRCHAQLHTVEVFSYFKNHTPWCSSHCGIFFIDIFFSWPTPQSFPQQNRTLQCHSYTLESDCAVKIRISQPNPEPKLKIF